MSALKLEHKATEKFVENLMLRFLVLAALSCFGSFVTTDVNAAEPAWGPAIGARVDTAPWMTPVVNARLRISQAKRGCCCSSIVPQIGDPSASASWSNWKVKEASSKRWASMSPA